MKDGPSCSACLKNTAEQVLVLCTELSGCAEQLWWELKMYLPPSVRPQHSWGKRQCSLSLHGSSALQLNFVACSNQRVCLVLQCKSFFVLIFNRLKFCLLSPAHVWNTECIKQSILDCHNIMEQKGISSLEPVFQYEYRLRKRGLTILLTFWGFRQ